MSLKEEKIKRVKREIEELEDGLGMQIDERIKKVVIALRVHDFPTFMSCEGHDGWGCPFPWVDIYMKAESPDSDKLFCFLIKFNTKRYVSTRVRLSLVFFPDPSVRLQPCGGWFPLDRNLDDFREEMDSFADFLIDEFQPE